MTSNNMNTYNTIYDSKCELAVEAPQTSIFRLLSDLEHVIGINREWISNVAATTAAFREISPNKASSDQSGVSSSGVEIADKLLALIQYLNGNNRYLEEIQTSIRL